MIAHLIPPLVVGFLVLLVLVAACTAVVWLAHRHDVWSPLLVVCGVVAVACAAPVAVALGGFILGLLQ